MQRGGIWPCWEGWWTSFNSPLLYHNLQVINDDDEEYLESRMDKQRGRGKGQARQWLWNELPLASKRIGIGTWVEAFGHQMDSIGLRLGCSDGLELWLACLRIGTQTILLRSCFFATTNSNHSFFGGSHKKTYLLIPLYTYSRKKDKWFVSVIFHERLNTPSEPPAASGTHEQESVIIKEETPQCSRHSHHVYHHSW